MFNGRWHDVPVVGCPMMHGLQSMVLVSFFMFGFSNDLDDDSFATCDHFLLTTVGILAVLGMLPMHPHTQPTITRES